MTTSKRGICNGVSERSSWEKRDPIELADSVRAVCLGYGKFSIEKQCIKCPVRHLSANMTLLDRMVLGVERVRDRLVRVSTVLEAAGLPYAVAGDSAVAAWVATVDAAAVRNTQDVDVLLRRTDLDAAARVLESAGFLRRHVSGIDMFLDGPDAKVRDAVYVVIAGEKVKPEYESAAPDVTDSVMPGGGRIRVLSLEALVRMKLTSFRRKDQVHLLDMLEIGLLDSSWVSKLGPVLGTRLQQLIDTPEQ